MSGNAPKRFPWSDRAGEALHELIKKKGTSSTKIENLLNLQVTAHTIDNWVKNRVHPTADKLAIVCKALGVQPEYFDQFIDGYMPKASPIRHPHSQLNRELCAEVRKPTKDDVIQFLNPPGYLSTTVLKELRATFQLKGFTCLYLEPSTLKMMTSFWDWMADNLKENGFVVPEYGDRYSHIQTAVENKPVLLLVDGGDSWILDRGFSRNEASHWLSCLRELPCHVVVAGLVDLGKLSLITGGPDSNHPPQTVTSVRNDSWREWTAAVCAQEGRDVAAMANVDTWARHHAGAYRAGLGALRDGVADVREAIRQYHHRIGWKILNRLCPELKKVLTSVDGDAFRPDPPRTSALVASNVLREESSGLVPSVPEWRDVWRAANA